MPLNLTSTPPAPAPAPEPERRKPTQRFRRSVNAVLLTPDQRRRQAAAMTLGWRMLGSREAVMAFFNTPSEALGGRPLDLAVDSDEGLRRVEQVLGTIRSDAVAGG